MSHDMSRILSDGIIVPEIAKYGIIGGFFYVIISRVRNEKMFQDSLIEFYDIYLGELPSILSEQCLPTILEAYEFGKKILGLIIGWFLLLFALERILIVLLWIIRRLFRMIFNRKKNSSILNDKDIDKSK